MWALKIPTLSAMATRIRTLIPLAPACASPLTPLRGRLFESALSARLRRRRLRIIPSSTTPISTHTADEDGFWRG
ncbi:hypothetical protein B0H17DRAFT_1105375 [Mycena rosella]|uniref:Uncharacterized protein n=1 Tax=Mycena rosella TaxID=1033263 RepID=A0AAD7FUY6_MYCRO|nr:hypothetical protein B0H17DRAFT_1105375 [Mycena rosella]